jgi:RNA-dependent RNA polymerase
MSEIVSAFKPPLQSPPPEEFKEVYFEKDVESVQDFCNQHRRESREELAKNIRTVLLSGVSKTQVGVYSKFHDNSTYHCGYDHPTTIRLAYM